MKANCLNPKRYLIAAALMLIGVVLTCYSAIADAQRRGSLDATSAVRGEPGERDGDPDYIEKRSEFLNRFFGTGPGGVSPTAYEAGRAMARMLPPSPLLQNERFKSPESPGISQLWTWPIALPIENSYRCQELSVKKRSLVDRCVASAAVISHIRVIRGCSKISA